MITKAVLLAHDGAVHRVIVGGDGADMTACGQHYNRHVRVAPLQALVYHLPECSGGGCWGIGMWNSFKDGVRA